MSSRYILTDEGFLDLICGICEQARKDLKDPVQRLDAERFFRSMWFYELTGLNGQAILEKLRRDGYYGQETF